MLKVGWRTTVATAAISGMSAAATIAAGATQAVPDKEEGDMPAAAIAFAAARRSSTSDAKFTGSPSHR